MCDFSHSATVSGVPATRDLAAAAAAFRPQIDDPVGGLDHVQVMLDDHDGVALIAQLMQHRQQLLDIGEVQAGGRFVEDIQRLAGAALRQLARQRRCASPPESVVADWPRRMWDSPTSIRVCSLRASAGTASKNSRASSMVISSTSWMLLPLYFTSSVSRL